MAEVFDFNRRAFVSGLGASILEHSQNMNGAVKACERPPDTESIWMHYAAVALRDWRTVYKRAYSRHRRFSPHLLPDLLIPDYDPSLEAIDMRAWAIWQRSRNRG